MRLLPGAIAHAFRIVVLAFTLVAVAPGLDRARAHEGHDHGGRISAETGVVVSPRVVAASDNYQLVGIVEGEVLVVYLDRAADNEPVTSAAIEVSLNGQPFRAELQKNGTYEVIAPLLKRPGQIEVIANISNAGAADLLVGALVVGSDHDGHATPGHGMWSRMRGSLIMAGAGLSILVAILLGIQARRRAAAVALLGTLLWPALPGEAFAHDGHDHGADIRASGGNSPQRRGDGTIFLPKPSQRLLEIRTSVINKQSASRTVRLTGRVAANPNFSGVVQSTIQGRYEAPAGGVPPLGGRVKAGDLLGRVAPAFASIDASDMAQTMGDIEQKLSIARSKLARQEHLLRTNVVAQALVDEIRLEVEGLVKRRGDLLAARVRAEELRAPVDGVIATSRAVSGQVVAQTDKLFEIIDPSRVLVEALIFDQVDPDAVTEAAVLFAGDTTAKLKLLGRSRVLQQQYALVQFEVVESVAQLSVGMPVTVIVRVGAPVSGLFVPRAALAQAPNGQTVVFEHKEPEVFVPRAVRTEPFDSQTVLITGGLEEGARIATRGASLINQVR